MSRNGRFETAGRRTRRSAWILAMGLGWSGLMAHGAVADLLPADQAEYAPALEPKAQRQADALSWFVTGLFAEESDGPEKALESYRKALDLDPGNTDLAVRLSFDHLRRGETAEAISLLKNAIKAAPGETVPCLALSSIYLRHLQKPDLALRYAQMAQESAPGEFPPYQSLWEIYQSQNQASKAAQVLDKAERSKSEDPLFWLALAELTGHRLLREGGATLTEPELQRITRALEKARTLGESDPAVLARIGDLLALSRQVDKALPFYQKLVEIKPSHPAAREKLAASYLETGRFSEAVGVLESMVKTNPLNVAAYDQLRDLHLRAENYEKALAAAEQALILASGDPARYDLVIRLCFDQRKNEAALNHAREAVKRFPKVPVFSLFEAMALTETKQPAEALKVFERTVVEAANSNPDLLDGDFYFSYGAAAEQSGQHDRAVELFQKSIALDPSQAARSYNYIGYMWVEKGVNLEEAGQLIRRALEMDPGNGAYIDSLGWLYYQQGKYQESFTELLRAAEALPEPDAVVFDHIGDAANKLGKKTEAILYWKKALALDPANKTLVDKLDSVTENVVQQPTPKP